MMRRHLVTTSYVFLGLLAGVALLGGIFAGHGDTALFHFVAGVRTTVLVATLVVVVSSVVGVGAAALAALGPAAFDVFLSRAIEIAGALPSVVVVAVLASVARTSPIVAIGGFLALKRGLESAKIARAELLQLDSEDFVLAARASGIGEARLFARHYLPYVATSAFARSTVGAAAVVGLDAAGSFLGMFPAGGSWGSLLAEASRRSSFALFVWPAAATAITVAALAVVADAVHDKHRLGRRFLS